MANKQLVENVIKEARSWLGTKYHHEGHTKGVGVDCAHLLNEVYSAAGVVEKLQIEHYPSDWQFHKDAERYLAYITCRSEEHLDPDYIPQPGDIVVWRFGRTFSHGAIVVEWPKIIHSYVRTGCTMADVSKSRALQWIGESSVDKGKRRPMRVFTLNGLKE